MAFSVVKTFLLAFSFFCYGTKAAVKPQFYCKMKSLPSSQSSVVQLPIYLVFFIQGICAPLPPTPMVALKRWSHRFLLLGLQQQTDILLTLWISLAHIPEVIRGKWAQPIYGSFLVFLVHCQRTHSQVSPTTEKETGRNNRETTTPTSSLHPHVSQLATAHGQEPAPKNHHKRCNWWEATGERLWEWTWRHEEKGPQGFSRT